MAVHHAHTPPNITTTKAMFRVTMLNFFFQFDQQDELYYRVYGELAGREMLSDRAGQSEGDDV